MTQVIANLLSNAAKYTPPGGEIRIRGRVERDELQFRVEDTGVGIAPEMLHQVFNLFTQIDGARDRSQGGLGVGLALVQRLIELHGGTVSAESEGPNRGSTFIVYLPVPRKLAISAPEDPSTKTSMATPLRSLRILVVDDNRDAANTMVLLLKLGNHEVRAAYSGREAIAEAAEFQPELVFLDIGLPDMTGLEAARQMRGQLDPPAKFVALTGWGSEDDKRRTAAAGFDYHVTKPIDLRSIQELLANVAKR